MTYFCAVRWLSRYSTLQRFFSLREEIKSFVESKGKNTEFLSDATFLNDLAFFVDTSKYLAEVNLKLQGNEKLITITLSMLETIDCFKSKLNLIKLQLGEKKLNHLTNLKNKKEDLVILEDMIFTYKCLAIHSLLMLRWFLTIYEWKFWKFKVKRR